MSAQVSERPTGEQPVLPVARGEGQPYPAGPVPVMAARTDPGAIAHALAGVRAMDFGRLDAARASGRRYADMLPGTPAPRGNEALYLATVTEHYTAPRPTFAPRGACAPARAPQPSAGALADDERARYALAELVHAAARHAEPPYGPYCADCRAADTEWCDSCRRADEKATGLDRLHDLILAADTYATAVVLVALSVLPPRVAGLGDITPGTPGETGGAR